MKLQGVPFSDYGLAFLPDGKKDSNKYWVKKLTPFLEANKKRFTDEEHLIAVLWSGLIARANPPGERVKPKLNDRWSTPFYYPPRDRPYDKDYRLVTPAVLHSFEFMHAEEMLRFYPEGTQHWLDADREDWPAMRKKVPFYIKGG